MPRVKQELNDLILSLAGDVSEETHKSLVHLAVTMKENGSAKDDPIREVMSFLGDKWCALILIILETGTFRYTDLKRIIIVMSNEENISQRILTLKLRALERDGMVQRSASSDVPQKTEYSLTPMGDELVDQTNRIIDWIQRHHQKIENARNVFDENN